MGSYPWSQNDLLEVVGSIHTQAAPMCLWPWFFCPEHLRIEKWDSGRGHHLAHHFPDENPDPGTPCRALQNQIYLETTQCKFNEYCSTIMVFIIPLGPVTEKLFKSKIQKDMPEVFGKGLLLSDMWSVFGWAWVIVSGCFPNNQMQSAQGGGDLV